MEAAAALVLKAQETQDQHKNRSCDESRFLHRLYQRQKKYTAAIIIRVLRELAFAHYLLWPAGPGAAGQN